MGNRGPLPVAIRSAVGSRGLPALTCLLHPSLDSESPRPPPTVLPPVLLTGPGSICPRKVTWEMPGFPHRTFRTGHPEVSQPLGTSLGFWALAMRFSGPHDLWESSDPRAGISGRFLGQVAPIARGSAHRLSASHPAQGPPAVPAPGGGVQARSCVCSPGGLPSHNRENSIAGDHPAGGKRPKDRAWHSQDPLGLCAGADQPPGPV